jgi:hypothetical protein
MGFISSVSSKKCFGLFSVLSTVREQRLVVTRGYEERVSEARGKLDNGDQSIVR